VWQAATVIAAACRLHVDARRMLHRGTVDTSDCSLAELLAVGGTPVNTLWPGSPGPCGAGKSGHVELVARPALAMPPRVRSGVLTTLLVAHRLRCRHAVVSTLTQCQLRMVPQSSVLIGLSTELWLVVCSFFCRSDERSDRRAGWRSRETRATNQLSGPKTTARNP